jgi:hypothetical protein
MRRAWNAQLVLGKAVAPFRLCTGPETTGDFAPRASDHGARGNGRFIGVALFNRADTSPLSRMSYGSMARTFDDLALNFAKSTQNTAGLLTGMT